jgi:BMFP domain-containing protein YqiC
MGVIGASGLTSGIEEADQGEVRDSGVFIDVPHNHWAAADLQYLVERGIITGLPGGEFRGDQALTRYSAAALVARTVQFVLNNPDLVTAQDIEVIQELMFKISDRLEAMSAELDAIKTQGDTELISEMRSQLQQNENKIKELERQLQQQKASVGSAEVEQLRRQAEANFIIAIAGLFVGIIGIALATMS